ncbi:MAG: VOC family protein [Rhizobiaceae bacterium]|nr:VOC family protein [Rhizobiaceae bacterium]
MIDHVTLSVIDIKKAKNFYQAALAPLGIKLIAEEPFEQTSRASVLGFGKGRKGLLWIAENGPQTPASHICFRSRNRLNVRRFYQAALSTGGTDNGAPGIRKDYHPQYYAAFVLDPEGHNIEAVCFEPEDAK